MPDMIGDANDLHQTKGIRAVAALSDEACNHEKGRVWAA